MTDSAADAFRSQMAGFRWAQGAQTGSSLPAPAAQPRTAGGFGATLAALPARVGEAAGLSAYVPLRSSEHTDEEEAMLSLSRWERCVATPLLTCTLHSAGADPCSPASFPACPCPRLLGFLACIAGSAVCFFFSFVFASPVFLTIRPHKFAFAFTAGSMLFFFGFAILSGPMAYLQHLCARPRLPFTLAYFGTMALTLYLALGPRYILPTMIAAAAQVIALLAYLAAYFPGGTTTLRFAGSLVARGGMSLLPI